MPAKGQDSFMTSALPRSVFLARLIGPVLVVVGIGVLANSTAYRALGQEFVRNPALIYLSGIMTLSAGLAIVLAHNDWTADWRLAITLLGWLAVVGGAMRILAPQLTESVDGWFLARPATLAVGALIWLAVGALLSFCGYFRPGRTA